MCLYRSVSVRVEDKHENQFVQKLCRRNFTGTSASTSTCICTRKVILIPLQVLVAILVQVQLRDPGST